MNCASAATWSTTRRLAIGTSRWCSSHMRSIRTLTVRQNIAFPLTLAKLPKAQIAEKVAETAKILDLDADFWTANRPNSQAGNVNRSRWDARSCGIPRRF